MYDVIAFGGPHASSWEQVVYLVVALVLCGCIGLEREFRHKSAGLRTNAVIGLAAALVMEVSKAGFGDVVGHQVVLDPSRVAAQVVTGIGFVGAGIIFVQRGSVRGLTTASTAWLAAAVGLACGAGLVALAAIVTGLHVLAVVGLSRFERPADPRELVVRFDIHDGQSPADAVRVAENGGTLSEIRTEPRAGGERVTLRLVTSDVSGVYRRLSKIPGVDAITVNADDPRSPS